MKRETVSKIVINEIEKLTGYSNVLEDNTFSTINVDYSDLLMINARVENGLNLPIDEENPTQLVDSFIEKRTKLLSTRPNDWPYQSWDETTMVKDYIDEMDIFLNK